MQLSNLLETLGLPNDFHVKNLQVNSNVAELTVKLEIEGKWIPIGSKVLEAKINDDGTINIDD